MMTPSEPEAVAFRRTPRPALAPPVLPETRIVAVAAKFPDPADVNLPRAESITAPVLADASASSESGGDSPAPHFARKTRSGPRGGGPGGSEARRAPVAAPPSLVSAPPPVYPAAARASKQEGVAAVRCVVRPDGSVAETGLQRGTGFDLLDEAAVKAARRWRFTPMAGLPDGTTIPVVVTVTFTL